MSARMAAARRWARFRCALGAALVTGVCVLLLAAPAGAAEGADGDQITVQVTIAPTDGPPGTLPATGLDPGMPIGVAIVLVATGVALVARRRIRSEEVAPSSAAR